MTEGALSKCKRLARLTKLDLSFYSEGIKDTSLLASFEKAPLETIILDGVECRDLTATLSFLPATVQTSLRQLSLRYCSFVNPQVHPNNLCHSPYEPALSTHPIGPPLPPFNIPPFLNLVTALLLYVLLSISGRGAHSHPLPAVSSSRSHRMQPCAARYPTQPTIHPINSTHPINPPSPSTPFPSTPSFLGALPNLPNYNALAVLHCPSPHSNKPTPSSAITAPGVDNTSGAGANLHPDFLGYHMLPDDQKKLIQMVLRSSHLTLILSYPHSNPTLL